MSVVGYVDVSSTVESRSAPVYWAHRAASHGYTFSLQFGQPFHFLPDTPIFTLFSSESPYISLLWEILMVRYFNVLFPLHS